MTKIGTALLGAALAVCVAASARAQTYTYQASFLTGSTFQSGSGNTTIQLFAGQAPLPKDATIPGGDDITPINVTIASTALANETVTANYQLQIILTDVASGLSQTEVFNGTLSGIASANGSSITHTPTLPDAGFERAFTLGSNNYTLGNFRYAAPQVLPPFTGAISAKVTGTNVIPEPGTFALLGTGLLPLVGMARRRRK